MDKIVGNLHGKLVYIQFLVIAHTFNLFNNIFIPFTDECEYKIILYCDVKKHYVLLSFMAIKFKKINTRFHNGLLNI